MFKTFLVKMDERVVVFRDGLPERALGPGRHTVWGFTLTERRWSTDQIVFHMAPELRAVLAEDWYGEIRLGANERGVLYHDGKPKAFLRPGVHHYWKVDATLRLEVLNVQEPMPVVTDELAAIIPAGEYIESTVREHERGLLHIQGRLIRTLGPGRYVFWSPREARVDVQIVDMRSTQLQIVGQELMTKDKVTLRLSLTIDHGVEDAALATHAVANAKDTLYALVQLAARDYVAGVTLDELLAGRDSMTKALEEATTAKAKSFGIRVDRVGVKDVVLPGEMKTLLNRVIEAEKEAAANVILRREETAATRSLANTAKVMAEQPILLRLKELESLKEIASRIHEVRVVVGADGLTKLLPAGLLTEKEKHT
jgi:regulator of protease activity HflC (stomatin/prohibitin superfamily)